MRTHDSREERPNVVAVFDSQEDSDEALLELRLAGFRDSRIGYYSQSPTEGRTNLLDRNYWMLGATLGAVAGAAFGVWLARAIDRDNPIFGGLDTFGLTTTCAVCGMLFLGFVGALVGAGIPRRTVVAPETGSETSPFVLAVNAGDAQELARTALRRHGGHELAIG
jgi:hypothetical protein